MLNCSFFVAAILNPALSNLSKILPTTFFATASGTIRADFADSIDANAVHGSDSLENAAIEIDFFFAQREIC